MGTARCQEWEWLCAWSWSDGRYWGVIGRCGMNPASLHDMKHSIVRAVQDYVDIEAEELIEVGCNPSTV
jgi:hypothetical protein